MKNILIITSAVLMFTIFSSSSCKREEKIVAGKGGAAIINATPQHHGRNIDSCTIFLKYNASEKPANYDDNTVCVMLNGKPVATFKDLKKGNYYVYGKGWDPEIGQEVVGGIPFTITEEKSYDIFVPVTEGD